MSNPTVRSWWKFTKYLPDGILEDPFWKQAPDLDRAIMAFFGTHSRIISKSPPRKYATWTQEEIAQYLGSSQCAVSRALKRIRRRRWILRWSIGHQAFTDNQGKYHRSMASRYEYPKNLKTIHYWRHNARRFRGIRD